MTALSMATTSPSKVLASPIITSPSSWILLLLHLDSGKANGSSMTLNPSMALSSMKPNTPHDLSDGDLIIIGEFTSILVNFNNNES